MGNEKDLQNQIAEVEVLKEELRVRKLSLPAHSLCPHQWLIVEKLEEKILGLQHRIKLLETEKPRQVRK